MNLFHIECVNKRAWWGVRRWFFRLVHSNGQTILTSEMYSSRQARDDSAQHLAVNTGMTIIGVKE